MQSDAIWRWLIRWRTAAAVTYMNKFLALTGVLLILATGLAAVGVLDTGGGGGGASPAQATVAGAAAASVPIAGFAFKPVQVTVAVGGKVTWTNEDSAPHTATADTGPTFDTGTLKQHQTKTISFPTAGVFTYHCAFHQFMKATVTVR